MIDRAEPTGHLRARGIFLAAALAALTVAGCETSSTMAPAPTGPVVTITTQEMIGKWGLASYRVEADIERTKAEAKRACSNPYVISSGASGGIMMHLADQATASEVFLKPAADGRVFVGPQGKPGDRRDRQIVSYTDGVMVTQWVDPDVATRYGTMVFVRCSAA